MCGHREYRCLCSSDHYWSIWIIFKQPNVTQWAMSPHLCFMPHPLSKVTLQTAPISTNSLSQLVTYGLKLQTMMLYLPLWSLCGQVSHNTSYVNVPLRLTVHIWWIMTLWYGFGLVKFRKSQSVKLCYWRKFSSRNVHMLRHLHTLTYAT